MVCEIQMGNGGEWEAFLADHTPQALDDQLKKISYEALSKSFKTICALSPEAMLKAIPMTMPMTHFESINGKKMDGVARYPLDAWEAAGNLCLTNEKWAMICLLIAERGIEMTSTDCLNRADAEVFEKLFTISTAAGASTGR